MESPLSPKDRAHLYADGHGRFVNFRGEHLFREKLDGRVVGLVATRALRIFQSRFRTDRINKARAVKKRERERKSFQTHFMQNRIGFPGRVCIRP